MCLVNSKVKGLIPSTTNRHSFATLFYFPHLCGMSVSLVISVYNDVLSLAAVLRSVKAQSCQKFEVIIAQDGDDLCFDALINTYNAFFPIQHLKQADEGFLKNRILNEGIRRANYDKMVFIDGDCFLHAHFLKAYNQSIQKGKICMGRRIDLDPKTTA